MNSIKLPMTAQTPSRLGMPICGHVFGVSVRATDGDRALAQSYFPGTSAWRPPTC